MSLTVDLAALELPSMPAEHQWEMQYGSSHNHFWSVTDESDPALAEALVSLPTAARYALALACAEWVLARVDGHVDTSEARAHMERAWQALEPGEHVELGAVGPSAEPFLFGGPLRTAMRLVAEGARGLVADDEERAHWMAMGLVLLARHLVAHPAFEPWLAESLRREASVPPAASASEWQQRFAIRGTS